MHASRQVRGYVAVVTNDCMTLRTTGEGGAVAVGVSATREAERASDCDGLSLAMNF